MRNLRGDDGNVGIIRSPLRAIVLPDHRFVIATPTPLAWRKAASGQPITRGCSGVAGVPSPGHAFKGTPCEPRRAHYLSRNGHRFSPTRMEPGPEGNEGVPGKQTNPRRGVPATKGDQRRQGRVGEQSYEPIVPAKVGNRRAPEKGRPRYPLEGRGEQVDASTRSRIHET